MLNAIAGKFMASPSNRTASREGDSATGIASAGLSNGALPSANGERFKYHSPDIAICTDMTLCFLSHRRRSAESQVTIWGA